MKKIPNGRQIIDKKDIVAVSQSLKRSLITTGELVKNFELKIKDLLKSKFTKVCSSGTAGLHLALLAINLKKNDVIIMPAINFIAVYNLSKVMGAKVILADVDKSTGQMTPQTLEDCIKRNNLKEIKAIITMYLGGHPENVVDFYKIKKKYKCYLIEDACHALGSQYIFKNKYYNIGSCKHSDISVFSLHPLKTITTGEGGIICTNNKNLDNKIEILRSHGIKKTKKHWIYTVEDHGFNYRLSDINCALGISQIKKISFFIKKRNKIAKLYLKNLKNNFLIPRYSPSNKSSYHLFIINLKEKNINLKNKIIDDMAKSNINLHYHYIPIFKMKKIFDDKKFNEKHYSGTLHYFSTTISLPIYVNMSLNDQNLIVKKLNNFYAT
jgi:UDP-4-amino-4,6-dideoxy-L-N-acetyl-beta-L-altrosamine transaminase|tara:strand:- start:2002 stop:3147 length:1146 start_codon:yes stop_codon:yes gene_type:complete